MAADRAIEQPNRPFWPGPNAAGMGKATVPPSVEGLHTDGTKGTLYGGRNFAGAEKNQNGPNAAGTPNVLTKP